MSLVLPVTAEGEDDPAAETGEGEVLATGEEDGKVLTTGEEDGEEDGAAPEESDVKTTGEESAAEAGTDSQAEESEDADNGGSGSVFVRHLPRWITLFVIIILIIVAVILARTKTKFGQKIAKFFRDYKSEIQKISWYSPKETAKATGVVLVFLIALAVAIGVLDFLFTKGIELLANLF
ncbi:MAG: preprotein translocase subunit SecE [Clostridia bacterium]|nr:preprotein translocase subunit SecE [Clostridia bacterium]MBR4798953.1 preprotein translocase subunit SecE [Clostridia bacterium]